MTNISIINLNEKDIAGFAVGGDFKVVTLNPELRSPGVGILVVTSQKSQPSQDLVVNYNQIKPRTLLHR